MASNSVTLSPQFWIDRLKRKSIRNISHSKWTEKYSGHSTDLSQAVLIICGLHRNVRTFYHIQIIQCMYEPFTGPHFVSINGNSPFWVHSLTAFRREFFNFTDKLSFERSVFMCLDNGEVIRLKIVRSYMKIPIIYQNIPSDFPGYAFNVYKTPTTQFDFAWKDYLRHQRITALKRAKAIEQNSAVRSRIRQHLFSSVEQLFSSYIRDTHVSPQQAYAWFLTDYQQASLNCGNLYNKMTRTQLLVTQTSEPQQQPQSEAQPQNLFTIEDMILQASTHTLPSPPSVVNPAPAVLTYAITNTLPSLLMNSFTVQSTPSATPESPTIHNMGHLQPHVDMAFLLGPTPAVHHLGTPFIANDNNDDSEHTNLM